MEQVWMFGILGHILSVAITSNLSQSLEEKFSATVVDSGYSSKTCISNKSSYGTYYHENVTSQFSLVSAAMPKYLLIQIKRFYYDWDNWNTINDSKFTLPNKIDMSKFLYNPISNETFLYSLHGVVQYQKKYYENGNGHYRYYVKSSNGQEDVMNWTKYDDEIVTWVSHQEAVIDNFGGNGSSSFAYGLMYKKIT